MADDKKIVKWRTTRKGHKIGINSKGIIVKGHPEVRGKAVADLKEELLTTSDLLERLEKIRHGEGSMHADFQAIEKALGRKLKGKVFGVGRVLDVYMNFHGHHKQVPFAVAYTIHTDAEDPWKAYHSGLKRKGSGEDFEGFVKENSTDKVIHTGKVRRDHFEEDIIALFKGAQTKLKRAK
jgi:hypothetical protein